jgi:hypothetical protein
MKRLALLLASLALSIPATASANANFASGLSSLKDVGDYVSAQEIDDGYDASTPDPAEEEDAEYLNAILSSGTYCVDSSAPPAQFTLAKATKKKKGRSRRNCGCASGCGMNQAGLKPIIKKFVAEAGKIGISPVSCIRTQACQNRLRACYESCGQRGRAAKNSKHSDGRACDFSKRDGKRLSALKKKTGLPIKRLVHGREGGGLHEFQ